MSQTANLDDYAFMERDVKVANGGKMKCPGMNNIELQLDSGNSHPVKNVMHAPRATLNLLSVSKLAKEDGRTLVFDSKECRIVSLGNKRSQITKVLVAVYLVRRKCIENHYYCFCIKTAALSSNWLQATH